MKTNPNWREKIGKRRSENVLDWEIGLYKEFIEFVEETYKLSQIYDWNFWGGKTDNYSISLSQGKSDGKYISLKMIKGDKYHYYVSFKKELNPNNIGDDEYKEFVGNTLDDALKYLHTYLLENRYVRESNYTMIRTLGNGYDKCFMRIRWKKEELVDKMLNDEFSNVN